MKVFITSLFFLIVSVVQGQIYDPVSFQSSVNKIDDTHYELLIKSIIEPGWHIYSQEVPAGGPVPTSFSFSNKEKYTLKGPVSEPEGHTVDDPVFEMRIKYFSDAATFKQVIERKTKDAFTIKASIDFMVCNDQSCLPPATKDVIFNIEAGLAVIEKKVKEESKQEVVATSNSGPQDELDTDSIENTEQEEVEDATGLNNSNDTVAKDKDSSIVVEKIIPESANSHDEVKEKTTDSRNLWSIFILSFLGGFAALLTPCVFPMIPMTVSFFTKQSKSRASGIKNAILYGVFIIVIYVILGSVVTGIFGADALNALSTNVWFNLIFFALLIVFAFSFLGAFEIMLPNSWANKIDSQADRGGFIGIFFMALALAIVSFSCTGPIVGTLLVEAASTGGIAPIIGMLGFSSAIALPFALFAAFPGWLNSLPRSGGWLNTVKVVLGFLELALAFKFLSNADLVLQLHLLERETFLAIWISVFGGLALYLFGKITLPHDSPLPHISVGRLSLGLFTLAFVVYLIPGLWGAPLQWISGFPPPSNYSESPYGVGNTKGGTGAPIKLPDHAELGPLDLITFKDYEKGMAYAKRQNKPVMLDFTGYACVNCRKMEERVWPEPKIFEILQNDLVLISLYVDDKKDLPESEQYISETTGKKIETIGNKWSDFQIKHYKANAQPYYVLIDNEGENLNKPTAYDPNIESYLSWLKEGIANYSN
ncbi:protein-disulfide reductase DsbD family protein [Leeuwenhoekiella marinoflava]|uniref:Thiol:disulfide interchange protein DsbD n=2 Tax=Leeuwenhoekiella marinoflava TaxID=988 RepID=A0A4Q0PQZ3_9FLAO|nr:thioredoxin family protein [Leeuwenhoekiella marinoflava]RXG32295.1 thiol:disulfide interchange protein DsbD [Leeuwenhoekiella marinoflava]SHE80120.1 thiol:disulfide interchange protein DsbD [Leeuwenhoekiella marinoflava DSM 3653]